MFIFISKDINLATINAGPKAIMMVTERSLRNHQFSRPPYANFFLNRLFRFLKSYNRTLFNLNGF